MPAGASQAACIIDCMKRQEKFMLSSNCYGSLLGRQPGAVTIGHSLIKTAWASATVPPCCTLPRIFGCHKLGVYTFEAVTEGHCPAVVAELAVSVCVCVAQISYASSLDGKRCQPAVLGKQPHRYGSAPACMVLARVQLLGHRVADMNWSYCLQSGMHAPQCVYWMLR